MNLKAKTLNLDTIIGRKVFVYYNLHTHMWSVRDHKTGLVLGHTSEISLTHAVFKVSEAGRQRVIREGKKNVHAGVLGYVSPNLKKYCHVGVTYNPYKYTTFIRVSDQSPILTTFRVYMAEKKVWADTIAA